MTGTRKFGRHAAWGWLLAAGILGLVSGCGVDDYEKRLFDEQKRIKVLEDEQANLSAPIEFPPVPVYYRPPKHVLSRQGKLSDSRGSLYFYPSEWYDPAKPASGWLQGVYVGAAGGDRDKFIESVQDALGFTDDRRAQPLTVSPPDREPLQFITYVQYPPPPPPKDQPPGSQPTGNPTPAPQVTNYYYFYSDQGFNAAVVFQVGGTDVSADVRKQIDMSLWTLAVGPQAAVMRSRSAFR